MSTKVVTGKVRFSYANIFEPRSQEDGSAKYSVTLLIPKSDTRTLGAIRDAITFARDAFRARNGQAALPDKPVTTLHDGDGVRASGEPFGEECKGCMVIAVSNKNKPVVVDLTGQPIIDPAELYSGCYGRASINFYGYSRSGKKGISASLLAVQKVADGEPFGTVGSASDFNDGFAAETDDWM